MDDLEGARPGQLARKASSAGSAITGTWRPATADPESRTAQIVFTSGADVERLDWHSGQPYIERLIVSDDAIDFARLRSGAPVLLDHDRFNVRSQVGVTESAWVETSGEQPVGVALIRFSEQNDDIFHKVHEGILRSASIGYRQLERKITERDDGPDLHEITRYEVFEISLVSVPADAAAQVRGYTDSTARTAQGEPTMEQTETRGAPPAATLNRAKAEERKRVGYIDEMCGKLRLPGEFRRELIDSDLSLEQTQTRVINKKAELDEETEVDGHIEPGTGQREADFAEIAAEAVLHRTGVKRTENQHALALAQRDFLEAVLIVPGRHE